MDRQPATEQMLVLSMLPGGPRERKLAFSVVLFSGIVFAAVAPFARIPLPRVPAFIPSYESALVVNDLITAALLFGQFTMARSRALLVLACGYLFTALITVCHALTFPGLFAERGLLGAGTQSTAWIYIFWHGGYPLAVIAYAMLRNRRADAVSRPPIAVALTIAVVVALVVGLTALATVGEAVLPAIMQDHRYTPAMIGVVAAVWSLNLLALALLVWNRPHSILDLWLMVVVCTWL